MTSEDHIGPPVPTISGKEVFGGLGLLQRFVEGLEFQGPQKQPPPPTERLIKLVGLKRCTLAYKLITPTTTRLSLLLLYADARLRHRMCGGLRRLSLASVRQNVVPKTSLKCELIVALMIA